VGGHSRAVSKGQENAGRPPLTRTRRRNGRRHPDPWPGCGLCRRLHTDPLLISLWSAWQLPKPQARAARIEEILKRKKAPYSVVEVEEHVAHHRAVQPSPKWSDVSGQIDAIAEAMKERHWEILRFVGQARLVSGQQIDELFFSHIQRSEGAESSHIAARNLRWMAHRHLLYRVWVLGQTKRAPRTVYGLGRAGAELLSELYPRDGGWSYLTSPSDVSVQTVKHDLHVGDLFLDLRRQDGKAIEVGERSVTTQLRPENFWAAGSVGVTVTVPHGVDELGRATAARKRVVRPDGFCVVGIDLDEALPYGDSFPLPLLLEYDSGRRRNREVAEQITSYLHVATSSSIKRRFPDLDIEGYDVPLLLVTRGYAGGHGRRRAEHLREEALQMISGRRLQARPPIYMAVHEDVADAGLQASVTDLWTGHQASLLEVLVRDSKELMKAASLSAESILTIDHEGAAERALKAEKDRISKSELARQKALEEAKRSDVEAYEREFAAAQLKPLPPGGQS
jgi:Replication-relaxation